MVRNWVLLERLHESVLVNSQSCAAGVRVWARTARCAETIANEREIAESLRDKLDSFHSEHAVRVRGRATLIVCFYLIHTGKVELWEKEL